MPFPISNGRSTAWPFCPGSRTRGVPWLASLIRSAVRLRAGCPGPLPRQLCGSFGVGSVVGRPAWVGFQDAGWREQASVRRPSRIGTAFFPSPLGAREVTMVCRVGGGAKVNDGRWLHGNLGQSASLPPIDLVPLSHTGLSGLRSGNARATRVPWQSPTPLLSCSRARSRPGRERKATDGTRGWTRE